MGTDDERADRIGLFDARLQGTSRVFGIALLATCVLPWAFLPKKTVFLWTLFDEVKGADAFFFGYTVVAGLAATLLGFVRGIAPLGRAIGVAATGLLGVAALAMMGRNAGTGPGGGITMAGPIALVGYVAAPFGLAWRELEPRSGGARVVLGVGILLIVLSCLIPAAVVPRGPWVVPIVGIVKAIGQAKGAQIVVLFYLLTPLVWCALAVRALLPVRDPDADAAGAGAAAVACAGLLYYVPSLAIVSGLVGIGTSRGGSLTLIFLVVFLAVIAAAHLTLAVRGAAQLAYLISSGARAPATTKRAG